MKYLVNKKSVFLSLCVLISLTTFSQSERTAIYFDDYQKKEINLHIGIEDDIVNQANFILFGLINSSYDKTYKFCKIDDITFGVYPSELNGLSLRKVGKPIPSYHASSDLIESYTLRYEVLLCGEPLSKPKFEKFTIFSNDEICQKNVAQKAVGEMCDAQTGSTFWLVFHDWSMALFELFYAMVCECNENDDCVVTDDFASPFAFAEKKFGPAGFDIKASASAADATATFKYELLNNKKKTGKETKFDKSCEGSCGDDNVAAFQGINHSNINTINSNAIIPKKTALTLQPNPTNGNFTLDIDLAESNEVQIQIYSMTGQKIFTDSFYAIKGKYQRQIALSQDLANGSYLLRARIGDVEITKTIMIAK